MARILVVDDCVADRMMIRSLLSQRSDWLLQEVSDGKEALELIKEWKPTLVLTDLQMPGVDGLELVERLRETVPGLPVVLVTARGSEELAVRALRAGAAGYVPKRLLHNELIETLERVIDLAQQQQNYFALLRQVQRVRWRVQLPNDLDMIRTLVSFVRRQLTEMGLGDEAEHFQICLALEEALSNAYYHGNLEVDSRLREQDAAQFDQLAQQRLSQPPYCHRSITVIGKLSPGKVQFVVKDEGPGFDPTTLPDPTDPSNLEKPSGRGIFLMKSFMEEVSFLGKGNIVRMSRSVGCPRGASQGACYT